ncbi:MAG: PmoA family protein [Verrucomicrobia bacterium]|nr:PmoA family protein [Verrucomicrobiota bacterium]
MKKHPRLRHVLAAAPLMALFTPISPAASSPLAFTVDAATQSYTITEAGRPVLTYRFGEVPLPAGVEAKRFSQRATPYDGAYFTDGSRYGGERSDYVHPIYGFNGEELTGDYPKDHIHHRGLWWSWCEVRRHDKIGDLWAVCKIRAYPVEIRRQTVLADRALLEAVNVWRYDDDPTPVVRETVVLSVHRTTGANGARVRPIDVDVRLEALVDGMAICGRQKVDYGGYGGMTIRLNGQIKDFSLRAVHPHPDKWRGDTVALAERVIDPAAHGEAAWLALYGRYPAAGVANPDFTTVLMAESRTTPLYPNQFRYYATTCTSLAFPGKTVVPLPLGKPLDYRTRVVVCEGKTGLEQEKALWQAYQAR